MKEIIFLDYLFDNSDSTVEMSLSNLSGHKSSPPEIERSGLESRHSQTRLFFHRKI